MTITQDDIELLYCDRDCRFKIELLEKTSNGSFIILKTMNFLVSGDYSEDCSSDARRTLNCTLFPDLNSDGDDIEQYKTIFIDKYVRVYVGYLNPRNKSVPWHCKGIFVITSCDVSNSTTDKSITLSLTDQTALLDGTISGDIDAVDITIPVKSNIRNAMISFLKLGGITNYRIDEIGMFSCLEGVTDDYMERRELNTEWNLTPYEKVFNTGTKIWEIIVFLRDIYPGFECFFDSDGVFVCQRIPTCETDDPVLTYDILRGLKIRESENTDLTSVRNITRIYGKAIETDRYADSCTVSGNTYKVPLQNFSCSIGTIIGIKMCAENTENMKIAIVDSSVTDLEDLKKDIYTGVPIMQQYVENIITDNSGNIIISTNVPKDIDISIKTKIKFIPYDAGFFKKNQVYCFKYTKCKESDSEDVNYYWLYQGQYQVQAICRNDDDTTFSTVKIGERLQTLSGGDWENITTDDIAFENASYENWKSCRLNETISLDLFDIPFLETNQKIEYMLEGRSTTDFYIIKTINEKFGSGTMNVTAQKFYRLYPNLIGATK